MNAQPSLASVTFAPLEDIRPSVVALAGLAGSGKSTACTHLQSVGYTLVKFAGPLKDMCRAIGMTEAMIEGDQKEVPLKMLQGKSPRQFMQLLGTEFGRDIIGGPFWVDLWTKRALSVLGAGGRVVVDDCRFHNEAAAVRQIGGDIYRLTGRGGIAGGHSSEKQGFYANIEIANTGSIDDLKAALDDALLRFA